MTIPVTADIVVGQIYYGQRTAYNSQDWFEITLQANVTYTMHEFSTGGYQTPLVAITNANNDNLGTNGVPPFGFNQTASGTFLQTFTPTVSGEYFVSARDFNNPTDGFGPYQLSVEGRPAVSGTLLKVNDSDSGSISSGFQQEYFTTSPLTVGHVYKIQVTAAGSSGIFNPEVNDITNVSDRSYIYGGEQILLYTSTSEIITFTASDQSSSGVNFFVGGYPSGQFTKNVAPSNSSSTFVISLTDMGLPPPETTTDIQNDYSAITRTPLSATDAKTVADHINSGQQTATQYVNSLLSLVANTTIPAVAVEASMYGPTGTSTEITSLTNNFLPAQVANAAQYGLNAQVYACEAVGLVFAFGNENGSTAFSSNFGPSNSAMPNTTAGDAAFSSAAANLIFGSASTVNLINVMGGFVSFWKGFFTANGVPGATTAAQFDLAARGTAWGDMVGVALANNLGSLNTDTINFLMDAAIGTAHYGTSLAAATAASQSVASINVTGIASGVETVHFV